MNVFRTFLLLILMFWPALVFGEQITVVQSDNLAVVSLGAGVNDAELEDVRGEGFSPGVADTGIRGLGYIILWDELEDENRINTNMVSKQSVAQR